MNERLKYLETLLDHYWSRFNIEYMNELRERHLSNLRGKKDDDRALHVGDMVLIKDDALKRNLWRQGVVEKLIVGNDDNVRGALLKTCLKNGTASYSETSATFGPIKDL